jgi:hypothetical protein
VIYTVTRWHWPDIEWIHAFQTTNVKAIFVGMRAALMVCVYAANGTKIVLGGFGIELVELQHVLAFADFHTRQWHRRNDRALAAANGAAAAARLDDALGQIQFQHDSAAVAGSQMLRLDYGSADYLDHPDTLLSHGYHEVC